MFFSSNTLFVPSGRRMSLKYRYWTSKGGIEMLRLLEVSVVVASVPNNHLSNFNILSNVFFANGLLCSTDIPKSLVPFEHRVET